MRYLSVCSGIEAATVAWHPLGWTPVAFSEIEKFPSAVLAHHYPDTPNLGDMTQHEHWPIGPGSVDLLVGGTPCQSFSVAGLRKGLADPRGNLALTYLAIADRLRPRWLVWENVPGVLSSSGGRDFGSFLGALAELGYGFAYRVLDAQFFGVAQRRRRVFVVGHLGDWRRAAAVLLEQSCLSRHPAPSREAREGTAADVAGSIGQRISRSRTELDGHGAYVQVVGALTAKGPEAMGAPEVDAHHYIPTWWDGSDCASTLTKEGAGGNQRMPDKDNFGAVLTPLARDNAAHAAVAMVNMQGSKSNAVAQADGPSYTLNAMHGHDVHAVAIGTDCYNGQLTGDIAATMGTPGSSVNASGPTVMQAIAVAPTLTAANDPSRSPQSAEVTQQVAAVHAATMVVRRLTPVECERLQGFPDGYTAIQWRGKPAAECPDGPRYRALGNSMAVPCMRWIGERIAQVDALP